jgi:hypothetical protein
VIPLTRSLLSKSSGPEIGSSHWVRQAGIRISQRWSVESSQRGPGRGMPHTPQSSRIKDSLPGPPGCEGPPATGRETLASPPTSPLIFGARTYAFARALRRKQFPSLELASWRLPTKPLPRGGWPEVHLRFRPGVHLTYGSADRGCGPTLSPIPQPLRSWNRTYAFAEGPLALQALSLEPFFGLWPLAFGLWPLAFGLSFGLWPWALGVVVSTPCGARR